MPARLLMVVLVTGLFACSEKPKEKDPWTGLWRIDLQLDQDQALLPFFMEIIPASGGYSAAIYNGDESIVHDDVQVVGDSIFIRSPYIQSELRIVRKSNELTGFWQDHSRGENYRIPLTGKFNLNQRFSLSAQPTDSIDGRWSVWFGSDSSGYPAVGEFETDEHSTKGTFLTETGDFRFLEGVFGGKELKLSAFDGSHAFLFLATLINDTLHGTFFSGSHYRDSFIAWRNDSAQLGDPYQQVGFNGDEPLKFQARTLEGDTLLFPNEFSSQSYLIQLMGSWCPNCLDESAFLSSKYTELREKNIEVIALAFERLPFDNSVIALDRLKQNLKIPYPILYGGEAGKRTAAKVIPQLDDVKAYPTLLFVDRNGFIRRVHTGFNGPGTGTHFNDQMEEFDRDIAELIRFGEGN